LLKPNAYKQATQTLNPKAKYSVDWREVMDVLMQVVSA
jgi:hypothetical protein